MVSNKILKNLIFNKTGIFGITIDQNVNFFDSLCQTFGIGSSVEASPPRFQTWFVYVMIIGEWMVVSKVPLKISQICYLTLVLSQIKYPHQDP